jgi:hypothetical protein
MVLYQVWATVDVSADQLADYCSSSNLCALVRALETKLLDNFKETILKVV